MNYRQAIQNFHPESLKEAEDKKIMLDFIKKNPEDVLLRKNKIAHLTSSAMIFNENLEKVLMIYHNIYKSWSWTGGHADGDEDFFYVAKKEACEETGLKNPKPLTQKIVSLDILPVFSHEKKGIYVSSHLHLSVAYALQASEKEPLMIKPDENSGVKWIEINHLKDFVSESHVLVIYDKIIKKIKEH